MLTLVGGPCEGRYMAKRAPMYLRAVISDQDGKNVLDQLADEPEPFEWVSVYQRTEYRGNMHIRATKGSGFYPMATYEYLEDVDGQSLRETPVWREWVIKENGGSAYEAPAT